MNPDTLAVALELAAVPAKRRDLLLVLVGRRIAIHVLIGARHVEGRLPGRRRMLTIVSLVEPSAQRRSPRRPG